MGKRLFAYVDEAGSSVTNKTSSDHFVAGAIASDRRKDLKDCLSRLRDALGYPPGRVLHWADIGGNQSHLRKVKIVQTIAAARCRIVTVVVAKRRFPGKAALTRDQAYLYTLRFLLERLSWMARDAHPSLKLDYTIAHVRGFKKEKLREYERRLREDRRCRIEWGHVYGPGSIAGMSEVEELQLADSVASSTYAAFEPNNRKWGLTERRYLVELRGRLYRCGSDLSSYGVKLHPTRIKTLRSYSWVDRIHNGCIL